MRSYYVHLESKLRLHSSIPYAYFQLSFLIVRNLTPTIFNILISSTIHYFFFFWCKLFKNCKPLLLWEAILPTRMSCLCAIVFVSSLTMLRQNRASKLLVHCFYSSFFSVRSCYAFLLWLCLYEAVYVPSWALLIS